MASPARLSPAKALWREGCTLDMQKGEPCGNPGIVNMTGGTIIVADDFMIPELTASTAEVNLDGGTIIVNGDLNMRADGGTMNVEHYSRDADN